jgi:hypothetical protein
MNSLFTTVQTNLAACVKAVRLIFDDVVHCHYLRADNNCFIFVPVAQLKVWAVKSPEDLSNEARFALFDEEGNLDLSTLALKTSKGVSFTCNPPNVLVSNFDHDVYSRCTFLSF